MSLRSPARHLDKSKLFESLEDSQMTTDSGGIMGGARETFVPRRSIKKLTIKPKVSEMSEHLQYLASYNLKNVFIHSQFAHELQWYDHSYLLFT